MAHRKHTRADDRAIERKRAQWAQRAKRGNKAAARETKPIRRRDPRILADEYVCVVTDSQGSSTTRSSDKNQVFRTGKRIARQLRQEGTVVALHATSERGALLERVETY